MTHLQTWEREAHAIDIEADPDGGWLVWVMGPGTGGEWESIHVDGKKPTEDEGWNLFGQLAAAPVQ